MARIRTIKPEFWTSEQITECSPNARLLFIGLLNFCDDSGVHPESVKRLKMEVLPSDDFTTADVTGMVEELLSAGLLELYSVADKSYWRVTGWRHQKIDQPTFKHPLPDGLIPTNVRRTDAESSPNVRRTVGERSMSIHPGKGEEGKGKEKGIGADAPDPHSEILTGDAEVLHAGKKSSTRKDKSSDVLGVHELVAEGVDRQHAADWLRVRRAKRMPLTWSAWESTMVEADKLGITPAEAIRIAAARGWGGFMATYARNAGITAGACPIGGGYNLVPEVQL